MHPNEDGIKAYRKCVQDAIDIYYKNKRENPEPPATVAFRSFLAELAKEEGVLPTNPVPGIPKGNLSTDPGWTTKDLNGLLMASIDNYDSDIYPELLTLSVRTESETQDRSSGFLTGVILRMYEYNPSTEKVILCAEKAIPISTFFMKTQLCAEQINCMSITHDGERLIVLDDCRLSNDVEITVAGYRYDGYRSFEYVGGTGYYEEGSGSVLHFTTPLESRDATLNCAKALYGNSLWAEAGGWHGYDMGQDEEAVYMEFQDELYSRFGLNGDDQRLRVNQYYDSYDGDRAAIHNRLMRLTAREIYVDDTDNVQHLACVYNCHYDDYNPVDGSAWWLYRCDDTGLLDPYREKTGGRPDYWEDFVNEDFSEESQETHTADIDITAVKRGQIITFGAYAPYGGMKGTVSQPIRWRVLDVQSEKLLLLSEEILEANPYDNRDLDDLRYEDSYMRTWHLQDILELGFTNEERSCILTTTVSNGNDPDTQDQLFLLSVEEIQQYMPADEDRVAYATESAKINGWTQVGWNECAYWWTRTRGDATYRFAYIRPDGVIDTSGEAFSYSFYGIRPAMWVTPAILTMGSMETAKDGNDAGNEYEGGSERYYDDGESALLDRLIETYSGDGEVLSFGYADYDADGQKEAFALVGFYDDADFRNDAELWYICKDHAVQCERAGGCYPGACFVTMQDDRICFCVNEGYFGSGGATRYWTVENQIPFLYYGEYMLEDLRIDPTQTVVPNS